jgi:hypothetical protein
VERAAPGAAMDEDPFAVTTHGDRNRLHRGVAGGAPIARGVVDMAAPQAVGTMVAVRRPGRDCRHVEPAVDAAKRRWRFQRSVSREQDRPFAGRVAPRDGSGRRLCPAAGAALGTGKAARRGGSQALGCLPGLSPRTPGDATRERAQPWPPYRIRLPWCRWPEPPAGADPTAPDPRCQRACRRPDDGAAAARRPRAGRHGRGGRLESPGQFEQAPAASRPSGLIRPFRDGA